MTAVRESSHQWHRIPHFHMLNMRAICHSRIACWRLQHPGLQIHSYYLFTLSVHTCVCTTAPYRCPRQAAAPRTIGASGWRGRAGLRGQSPRRGYRRRKTPECRRERSAGGVTPTEIGKLHPAPHLHVLGCPIMRHTSHQATTYTRHVKKNQTSVPWK